MYVLQIICQECYAEANFVIIVIIFNRNFTKMQIQDNFSTSGNPCRHNIKGFPGSPLAT